MSVNLTNIKMITDLSEFIKEKPARAVYEFILLTAAIFITVSLFGGQGGDAKALILPVFVLIVIMVLVLVSQSLGEKKIELTNSTKAFYYSVWLSFTLMSLVLVCAIADAVSGGRLSSWIPEKLTRAESHLSDRFFGRYNFFKAVAEEIQTQEEEGARAPTGLSCENEVVFHFISPQFQIGVRGFTQISKANQEAAPKVELFPKSNSKGFSSANYITWSSSKNHEPILYSRNKDPNNPKKKTITVNIDKNSDIAWFQGFQDAAVTNASWFVVPLDGCPDGDQNTNIHHIVAVENELIGKWNPNKYLFDYDAFSKTFQFSETTFKTTERTDKLVSDTLMPILQKVATSVCEDNDCLKDENKQAQTKIHELIKNDKIFSSVTLFSASQQRNMSATRVIIFKFP